MALEELNSELHKHDGEERAMHPDSPYDPEIALKNPPQDLQQETSWSGARRGFFATHARSIRIGSIAFGVIVFVALLTGVFSRLHQSLFANDRVTVSVSGQDSMNSSNISYFTIEYENQNRASLRDAELVVSYPSNFHPEKNAAFINDATSSSIHIGDVAAFSQGKFEFSGKFYGSKGATAFIRAELRYTPNGIESEFIARGEKTVVLRTSSLALEIDAPLEVSSQGEVTYLAHYENTSDSSFSNVRMKANYPEGFSFAGSDPLPSEGNSVWYLGSVPAGARGDIRITGSLQGKTGETKSVSFEMGTFQGDNTFFAYSNTERTTRIVALPFDIAQSVNDRTSLTASPGETLRYVVHFKNSSAIGLRGAIVTVELRGEVLELSKLLLDKGSGAYDDARKTITWKASDVKALANLAPGEEGTVLFSLPIRDNIAPANASDKNYRVTTIAKIESPDVPNPSGANKIVATNTLTIPINSRLSLETLGFYTDAFLPNEGPIPPVIGSETTYSIYWKLSNTTNDLSGAEVSAQLPTGARWIGKSFPEGEALSYNERTNRIVWNVGSVPIGTGTLSPKREVAFRVGVTPQANQVNLPVALLSASVATAKDLFTGDTLRSETNPKTTQLSEDSSIPSSGYKAVSSVSGAE